MKKAIVTGVVMVFALAGVSLAGEKAQKVEKLTGEVVKIDATAGSLTIKTHVKEHSLKAEAKLLEGIKVGDKVEVEVAGAKVKSIKKIETPSAPTPTPAPEVPK